MIQHVWSVACTRAVVDSESNNISLIEVLEEVNLSGPALPAGQKVLAPANVDFVTLWTREEPNTPEAGRSRVVMSDPDGQEIAESVFEIDLSEKLRMRAIMKCPGLPVVSGRVRIEVFRETADHSWERMATVPIMVSFGVSAPNAT